MKKHTYLFVLFFVVKTAFAQPTVSPSLADSLKRELAKAKDDTAKVLILEKLTRCYTSIDLNRALSYGRQGKALAERIGYMQGRLLCTISLGFIMARTNDHVEGLQILMEAKQFCEKANKPEELARVLSNISSIYTINKDYQKAIEYSKRAQSIQKENHISEYVNPISLGLGVNYRDMGQSDSAIVYLRKALQVGIVSQLPTYITSSTYYLGTVYAKLGQVDSALKYYHQSITFSEQLHTNYTISRAYQGLAKLYVKAGQLDSTIFYGKKALLQKEASAYSLLTTVDAATLLADVYEKKKDPNEALRYYKMATTARDSLFSQERARQIEKLSYEEKEREARTQRRIEAHRLDFINQVKIYALLFILGAVLIFAFFLYRNNRQKHKANDLLHRQKEEIHHERNKAEKALADLRATQAQLVQAEKLASLGELTAGIAHEIQNPLNFVNNFSEITIELIEEIAPLTPEGGVSENWVPDTPFGGWGAFMSDITQNLQKINFHGKRASSIVKGMLEHSRQSTGERQLTDINQLADEYLRLSYHGLRAKDKSNSKPRFNADYELIADKNIPQINAVSQDIGRVLLNLINNAFYAVYQKTLSGLENTDNKAPTALGAYQPKVTVTTQNIDNQVVIRVKDNGIGMSEGTKSKIFQPFFTTKSTGEGTGLGLSLAYDIVTKGHGGTLECESVEGEGTEFVVRLPIV